MEFNQKNIKTVLLIILFAVVIYTLARNVTVILSLLVKLSHVLATVTAGFCIAFILNVPLNFFEKKVFKFLDKAKHKFFRNCKRALSLIATMVVALGIVVGVVLVVLPKLGTTITGLAEALPGYIDSAMDWIEGFLERFNIERMPKWSIDWDAVFDNLYDYVLGGNGNIIGSAANVTTSLASGVISGVFAIVIGVYILAQKERVGRWAKGIVVAFLPDKASDRVLNVARLSNEVFANFITGQLIEAIILGVLCYIGMLIFRFPYPEIIAVVIGTTSLVPMVGSFIGELIGAFLILLISPLKALFFVIFILVLQQLEGSLIYPRVVGKSVGLPGVLVLISVIIGSNLGGVAGALLGVPVCAVLFIIIREAVRERTLKKAAADGGSGLMDNLADSIAGEKKGKK
jgi:predicted PurR-regulated permease PerM